MTSGKKGISHHLAAHLKASSPVSTTTNHHADLAITSIARRLALLTNTAALLQPTAKSLDLGIAVVFYLPEVIVALVPLFMTESFDRAVDMAPHLDTPITRLCLFE